MMKFMQEPVSTGISQVQESSHMPIREKEDENFIFSFGIGKVISLFVLLGIVGEIDNVQELLEMSV